MEQVLEEIYDQIVDETQSVVQSTPLYFAQFFASIKQRIVEVLDSRVVIRASRRQIQRGIRGACRDHMIIAGADPRAIRSYEFRNWDDVDLLLQYCAPADPADPDAVIRLKAKIDEIKSKHEVNENNIIESLLAQFN